MKSRNLLKLEKKMKPNKMAKNGLIRDEKGKIVSGVLNPKGRPKGWTLTEVIRKELEKIPEGFKKDYASLLAEQYIKRAIKGDPTASKLVINYIDGMPKQSTDITSGGEPVKSIDINIKDYGSKSK